MPTTLPAFMATSRLVNQRSDSKSKPSGQKTGNDNTQWDPIPITYTELLSKLIDSGFIVLFYLAPLRPPFPSWYNANVRCDYHAENLGHSTKNCNALKHKVQSLIKDGKLKFEDSNGLAGMEDPSRAKGEAVKQEQKASKKANSGKVTMPSDKVPIAKFRKSEADCSSTTKGSKERPCGPKKEEEKRHFRIWYET